MDTADTIAAISSMVGACARLVIRLSGPRAWEIGGGLAELPAGLRQQGGGATVSRIWPGVAGYVYAFVGPRSYTGQDLVEFHVPGSPVLARMLLEEMIRRGARHAQAGEFTARAYFNGRLDLTQAEGVAASIAAHSQREMLAARQLLGGELARRLAPVMDDLAQTLALVEVGIDFSDEEVTFVSGPEVAERCRDADRRLAGILDQSARFERLSHEPRVVLVGRPNAGKSTLLNALAGAERAVVSEVAGTTRDAIGAHIRLARGMVQIIDVAGLEESPGGRSAAGEAVDPATRGALESVQQQMRQQALQTLGTADRVVLVHAADDPGPLLGLPRVPELVVRSKSDLTGWADPGTGWRDTCGSVLAISAKLGDGLDDLRARLDLLAFGEDAPAGTLALNARHVRSLEQAREALGRTAAAIPSGAEVVALGLRECLEALGSIVGQMSPDDLLGRIFSTFCIGK